MDAKVKQSPNAAKKIEPDYAQASMRADNNKKEKIH